MITAALEVSAADFKESEREATPMEARQFVTFFVGDEVFAVPMAPVREIIRVPDVVRVPLSPAGLEGLANLRGLVLPVISLRRIFHFPERAHDDATRALVIISDRLPVSWWTEWRASSPLNWSRSKTPSLFRPRLIPSFCWA